jgi:hypothetical protein
MNIGQPRVACRRVGATVIAHCAAVSGGACESKAQVSPRSVTCAPRRCVSKRRLGGRRERKPLSHRDDLAPSRFLKLNPNQWRSWENPGVAPVRHKTADPSEPAWRPSAPAGRPLPLPNLPVAIPPRGYRRFRCRCEPGSRAPQPTGSGSLAERREVNLAPLRIPFPNGGSQLLEEISAQMMCRETRSTHSHTRIAFHQSAFQFFHQQRSSLFYIHRKKLSNPRLPLDRWNRSTHS